MKRFSCSIVIVLTVLPAAGLISLSAHEHAAYSYRLNPGPVFHGSDWMSMLPDWWVLNEISIPGTHDTMSSRSGGDAVITQTMSLNTQLESGLRAFDIRCRHIENRFDIHHGSYFQKAEFGEDVRDVVIEFLRDHPTETVLMRVKEEYNPKDNTRAFYETFRAYREGFQEFFWQPPDADYIPTLGEVRGRIVVLQQFDDPLEPVGLIYPSNDGRHEWIFTNGTFAVQDRYAMATNWDLYDKWLTVKKHVTSAMKSEGEEIYVNHLSAAEGGFPYFFASGHSNPSTGAPRLATGRTTPGWKNSWPDFPRVSCFIGICTIAFEGTNILTHDYLARQTAQYISQGQLPPPVGIIMADFPGAGLISVIIRMNGVGLDVVPVADANGPYEGDEGATILLDGGASFDLGNDDLLYRWDFETDGAWDTEWSSDPTTTHIWLDDWDASVTLEVHDGTWTDSDDTSVVVDNVAPAGLIDRIGGPVEGCILPNQDVDFVGSFTDPGALDTHTATWSFGDSTTDVGVVTEENIPPDATGMVTGTHVYGAAGTYSVQLEIHDDDGGVGTASAQIKLRTPVEAVDCLNEFFESLPNGAFRSPAMNRRHALAAKVATVRRNVEAGRVRAAIDKLLHDVRAKGDAPSGGTSGNDWLRDEEAQRRLYLMVNEVVQYLRSLH